MGNHALFYSLRKKVCLNDANITPYPDVADLWGREYFLNYRMEDTGDYYPEGAYGQVSGDPRDFQSVTVQHWKGKAHIYMPCLGSTAIKLPLHLLGHMCSAAGARVLSGIQPTGPSTDTPPAA